MLRAVTGFDYSPEGLDAAAAGIVEARKRFNVREGWNPDEDILPDVIFESSPDSNTHVDRPPLTLSKLNSMIAAYNAARGWSFDGYPPNAISASADERIDERPEPFPKLGRFQ
jgi:aldehyde:ferredoxin oxidoreductase